MELISRLALSLVETLNTKKSILQYSDDTYSSTSAFIARRLVTIKVTFIYYAKVVESVTYKSLSHGNERLLFFFSSFFSFLLFLTTCPNVLPCLYLPVHALNDYACFIRLVICILFVLLVMIMMLYILCNNCIHFATHLIHR